MGLRSNFHSTHTDILLIQELYIYKDLSLRITRTHSTYKFFTPIDEWSIRLCVLTYTKKDAGITYTHKRPELPQNQGRSNILFL